MKFKAEIDIMPLPALLDPQGKAVSGAMQNIGLPNIQNVRIGKHISLEVEADDLQQAEKFVETACQKLLANLIVEQYTFKLTAL